LAFGLISGLVFAVMIYMAHGKVVVLTFISLFIFRCRKHSNVVTPSITPKDTSLSKVLKIAGIRNWHGTYHYGDINGDTTYGIVDTFGWVIVNDSTISNSKYVWDTLKLVRTDSASLVFELLIVHLYDKKLYFYFADSSLHYLENSLYTNSGYSKDLVSP
jgi:hypothetical protein